MKWLFFALLIVNVGLAAFQWVKHREQSVSPEFQEDGAVNKIVLLNDEVPGVSGQDEKRCVLVGPIGPTVDLDELRKKLAPTGGVELVEQQIDKAPSYWVFVPAANLTKSVEQQLKDKNFDGYFISSGENKGSYSLGVFENIDLARRLVKKVKGLGINASISEKKKSVLSYWLEYEVAYASENQAKIAEVTAFLPKELKKREIFCKSVASGK